MVANTNYQEQAGLLGQKLKLPASQGYDSLRKTLISRVKKISHDKSGSRTREDRQEELTELCGLYYEYHTGYIGNIAPKGGNDHEEAGRIKSEGGAITRGVGKVIIEFLVCEMELYSTMADLDRDIEQARGAAEEEHKNIEWSYDLPKQIAISCRRRDLLSIHMARIRKAKPIVELLDVVFKFLDRTLLDIIDPEQAKRLMDDFIGSLRKRKFLQASAVFDEVAARESKAFFRRRKKERREKWVLVLEISKLITQLVQRKAKQLSGREDNIFLRSFEVRLAYDDMEKQLLQSREYIAKYQVPEIRYRRDALDREQERLYKIGIFETLLGAYEQLERASKFPMKTLKDVRSFEAEVYGEAKKIIGPKAEVVKQTRDKIEALSKGPESEAISDEALFAECSS